MSHKRGLSIVLSTIIILVASVTLAASVAIYGANLFQTTAKQEQISVQGIKVWVDPTDSNGLAWGAAAVRNSGDKIFSVDKIDVRGVALPYNNWYADANQTRVSVTNFQANFIHSGSYGAGGKMADSGTAPTGCTAGPTVLIIDQDGAGGEDALCMRQANGPIALEPGNRFVIYFQITNGTLSSIDSGSATTIKIYANKVGSTQSITVGNP